MLAYQHLLTPNLIWNIAQNKPSLIVADLVTLGVDRVDAHNILLARGVYKWLSVRRQLIALKDTWKVRVNLTLEAIHVTKCADNAYQLGYQRGYLKAYEECRAEVRELCHSTRWQAPDYDREAQQHLKQLEHKLCQN